MSSDQNIIDMPLTFENFDEIILNEREQKHLITSDGMHVMPSLEYIELRDAYIKLVKAIQL